MIITVTDEFNKENDFQCPFNNIVSTDETDRCIVPGMNWIRCDGNPKSLDNCPLLFQDIVVRYKPKPLNGLKFIYDGKEMELKGPLGRK